MPFPLFVLMISGMIWDSHSAWVHPEITINLSRGARRHPTSPSSQELLLGLGTRPCAGWSLKSEMTNLQGHLPFFSLFQVFTLGTLSTFLLNAHQLAWFPWPPFLCAYLLHASTSNFWIGSRVWKLGVLSCLLCSEIRDLGIVAQSLRPSFFPPKEQG